MSRFQIDPDERIVLSVSDHWINLFLPVFLMGVASLLGLGFLLGAFLWVDVANSVRMVLFAIGLMSLFGAHTWFFILLFAREFSESYVTEKRVIICDILPYLRHDVSFFEVDSIKELDRHKHGLLPNLLNYGTIEMNLTGAAKPIKLTAFPKPGAFVNMLQELHRQQGGPIDLELLRSIYPIRFKSGVDEQERSKSAE